jgi:DNA mismatch repair protein MutS
MSDIERITARVALGRASPRDLLGLGTSLRSLDDLRNALAPMGPPILRRAMDDLGGMEELADTLKSALKTEGPPTVRDGGVFAEAWDAELTLRVIGRDGQSWLADYQKRLVQPPGSAVESRFQSRIRYYIEITPRGRVPADFVAARR